MDTLEGGCHGVAHLNKRHTRRCMAPSYGNGPPMLSLQYKSQKNNSIYLLRLSYC